jgi:hypothetical protein
LEKILEIREQIYNYFHDNKACQAFFYNKANEGRYAAYYASIVSTSRYNRKLTSPSEKRLFEKFLKMGSKWGQVHS